MKRSFKCVHPKDGAEVEQECGCTNHIEGHVTFCKLHAAAPEMYAELKAIRNEMQVAFSRSEPRITHQWLENRIKRMDAAIRKAEEGL